MQDNDVIVESQYNSLCGPKPDFKTAILKLRNNDLEHLLVADLKKLAKKAETSTDMFKKLSNQQTSHSHSKSWNVPLVYHKMMIFCTIAKYLHQKNWKQKVKQPEKLPNYQEPVYTKDKEIETL